MALAHVHVPLTPPPAPDASGADVFAASLREMDRLVGAVKSASDAADKDDTLILFTGQWRFPARTGRVSGPVLRCVLLCLGDNGPWERKCQYSGSVGPFVGKWQRSRGMKNQPPPPMRYDGCAAIGPHAPEVVVVVFVCLRRRLGQADDLGGGSPGADGGLLAREDPRKHHQLRPAQVRQ